jgi:hypothetical protein
MNTRNRQVPTEFGPETRFELTPVSTVPFRTVQESRFEALKNGLLRESLEEALDPKLTSWLRRAANDAAALAWVTPYPLLVFPVLFEEKAQAAALHVERQEHVCELSRELMAV